MKKDKIIKNDDEEKKKRDESKNKNNMKTIHKREKTANIYTEYIFLSSKFKEHERKREIFIDKFCNFHCDIVEQFIFKLRMTIFDSIGAGIPLSRILQWGPSRVHSKNHDLETKLSN